MIVTVRRKVKVHKRRKSAIDRRRKEELRVLIERLEPSMYYDAIGYLKVLAAVGSETKLIRSINSLRMCEPIKFKLLNQF